jgi:CHAT domain-containing protein
MDDFYKRLAGGASVADAVGEARKVIRSQPPPPYYWAPFVLIGQWR